MGTVEEVLGRLQRQGIETRGATLRDENKVTKWCMHIPLRYIRVLYILSEAATFKSKVPPRLHIQIDGNLTSYN